MSLAKEIEKIFGSEMLGVGRTDPQIRRALVRIAETVDEIKRRQEELDQRPLGSAQYSKNK